MKKWEKPVIENLKLKDTLETECSCPFGAANPNTKDKNKHPCHKTGNGEHNNNGNHGFGVDQNGHSVSIGCTEPSHLVDGVLICCCYEQITGGQS